MNSEEAIRIPWQIKELTEQVKCLKVQLEDAERRYRDARIAGVDMEIENEKLRLELEKPREEHLASLVRKLEGTCGAVCGITTGMVGTRTFRQTPRLLGSAGAVSRLKKHWLYLRQNDEVHNIRRLCVYTNHSNCPFLARWSCWPSDLLGN